MKIFELTHKQQSKVDDRLMNEVNPTIIVQQRSSEPYHPIVKESWDLGYPYEGAIGGGLTYSFTPTSLGVIVKAKYGEFTLDLTDYDSW